MLNQIDIQGQKAIISFDAEIGLFRGEFIGLNGGADFYATSVDELIKEGEVSLSTFIEVCNENNIEPYETYSGKLIATIPPSLHEKIRIAAASAGLTFNQWVQTALEREVSYI